MTSGHTALSRVSRNWLAKEIARGFFWGHGAGCTTPHPHTHSRTDIFLTDVSVLCIVEMLAYSWSHLSSVILSLISEEIEAQKDLPISIRSQLGNRKADPQTQGFLMPKSMAPPGCTLLAPLACIPPSTHAPEQTGAGSMTL